MITVDLQGLIPPELLRYPDVVAATIPDIAEAIRTEIIRLAHERLRSSAADYVQGLVPVKYHMQGLRLPPGDAPVATIALEGMLPNMVEQGWAGGDMKPALLAGRNSRPLKDGTGRYNVVPFRHGTPGVTGNNMPEMGSAYAERYRMTPGGVAQVGTLSRKAARELGDQIHAAARKLAPTTSHPGSGTRWGGRLAEGHAPKLEAHHKTDLYAGMVRQEKVYKQAKQSQYTTFRAVSSNSDPAAWIHPGIEGHHLFDAAAAYAGKAASFLLGQALQGLHT